MDLQKINFKIFSQIHQPTPLWTFVEIFNRWIQDSQVDDILIDVADYTHVFQGPGVILVAYQANYAMDETDGRLGFLYDQKRSRSNADGFIHAYRKAVQCCSLLESDPQLRGKITFSPSHFSVWINDRLEAPNDYDHQMKLEKLIKNFSKQLFPNDTFQWSGEEDPRKRCGFEVQCNRPFNYSEVLGQ